MAKKMTKKALLESELLSAPGLSNEQILSVKFTDSVGGKPLRADTKEAKARYNYVPIDPALVELVRDGGTVTPPQEIPLDELMPMFIVHSAHRHWKNRQL